MPIKVLDIAARCLSYANLLPTDALPTGSKGWLIDAIMEAIDEMRERAPGLFRKPLGGVLRAMGTVDATVTAAAPHQVTLANATTVPNNLCTVRLTGSQADATIFNLAGVTGEISPNYAGVLTGSVTVPMGVWHDAFLISDGGPDVSGEGMTVKVNGRLLDQAGSREQAESFCGNVSLGRRLACSANEWPRYWWPVGFEEQTFIMLYPMPAVRMEIDAEVIEGALEITEDNVLTSDEGYNFPDAIARSIWRPLALEKFMASPIFANAPVAPAVLRAAQAARDRLDGMTPKKRRLPDWNARGTRPLQHGRRY